MIKELAEEFKKQFTCLGENTEKYISFTILLEKKVLRIDKNEEEIQKKCLTCYNLLLKQDSWQVHYQILSIIILKKFIELNLNMDTMIENVKHVKLNIGIATPLIECKLFNRIQMFVLQ